MIKEEETPPLFEIIKIAYKNFTLIYHNAYFYIKKLIFNMKKLNTEEFIKRAKENGYIKFDYSKVNYINNTTKICIICPEHGEQWVNPVIFFKKNKYICPQCYKEKNHSGIKYTNDELIKVLKEKHKDKLNLSFDKVNIIDIHSYVTVTCSIHGDHKYKAYQLLHDDFQCKFCNKENKYNNTALKHYNNFIIKAKEKWPNIDYSKTLLPTKRYRYKRYNIICPIHGEQWVTDNVFLEKGCPKCENGINQKKSVKRNYTNEEFINELKLIYGDKYDYSKVNYIDWKTKIELKCEKHGWFYREPSRLIHDPRGCPYCNKSLLEDNLQKFLDENNIKYIKQFNTKFLGLKKLDFYLPEYNVGIECQGRQHFYQNSKFNINTDIKDVIKYDENKYKLCIENGIKMYYFTNINFKDKYFTTLYKDPNELLNKILKDNE